MWTRYPASDRSCLETAWTISESSAMRTFCCRSILSKEVAEEVVLTTSCTRSIRTIWSQEGQRYFMTLSSGKYSRRRISVPHWGHFTSILATSVRRAHARSPVPFRFSRCPVCLTSRASGAPREQLSPAGPSCVSHAGVMGAGSRRPSGLAANWPQCSRLDAAGSGASSNAAAVYHVKRALESDPHEPDLARRERLDTRGGAEGREGDGACVPGNKGGRPHASLSRGCPGRPRGRPPLLWRQHGLRPSRGRAHSGQPDPRIAIQPLEKSFGRRGRAARSGRDPRRDAAARSCSCPWSFRSAAGDREAAAGHAQREPAAADPKPGERRSQRGSRAPGPPCPDADRRGGDPAGRTGWTRWWRRGGGSGWTGGAEWTGLAPREERGRGSGGAPDRAEPPRLAERAFRRGVGSAASRGTPAASARGKGRAVADQRHPGDNSDRRPGSAGG